MVPPSAIDLSSLPWSSSDAGYPPGGPGTPRRPVLRPFCWDAGRASIDRGDFGSP